MLDKNIFIVWTFTEDGKHIAMAEKVHAGYNLLGYSQNYKNLTGMNVVETWKGAKELADFWNDCYRQNGTYMYL